MAHLRVIEGPDRGKVFSLEAAVTQIGRHPSNAAVLGDGAASRHHAQVIRRGDKFYVRDLGSRHGTYVNEVRNNAELLLSEGDRLRIGSTTLVFSERAAPPRAPEPTQPPTEQGHLPRPIDLPGQTIALSLRVDTAPGVALALPEQYTERLLRVAEAIRSVFDLNQLLGTLMDTVFEVFRPERGVLLLRDETTQALVPRVSRPVDCEVSVSQTIIEHSIAHRSSLLVSDAAGDQRFGAAESVMAQAILSVICSPLISKDRVFGCSTSTPSRTG